MKTQIKTIIIVVLSAAIITSCNSGETKTQNLLNYQTFAQQYKSSLSLKTDLININLYNSIFISPDKEYNFEIKDLQGTLVSNGVLSCKNLGACILSNINVKTDSMYLLSIYDKSNNSFVGGTTFNVKNGITYFELSVDDISTANYISVYMQQKLENQFEVVNIENRLFSKAISYTKNTSLSQIMYAYYNFLRTNQNQSHDAALSTIAGQYIACEQNNICELNSDFTKNEQSIIDAINKANASIEKYAQDKKDADLYESYKWFKENIKDNFDKYKDAISGGVDIFFPGTGGTASGAAGKIFDGIETIFKMSGLDDSKAAFDRIQLFNSNLSKYYTASTPNYLEIANQLSAQLLGLTIRKDFLTYGAYAINIQTAVNNSLLHKGIIEFINGTSQSDALLNFEWIKQVWNINDVSTRKTNIEYITNGQNISALAEAYKTILKTTRENNINNIKNRQYYNQLLMSNMQDAITALQASMYLDTLAIMMKDKKLDFKGALSSTQIFVSTIVLTGDYNTDIANLNSYYSTKLNNLKIAYQSVILPEKEFVASNVLQSVETEGKCLITGTDGLNNLTATCPYYYKNGNVLKTKYITSTLDKPALNCLTVNEDASGDITQIADVRNILGSLQCLIKSSKSNPYLAVEPFADVNSGNAWYWNNSSYFYPNMQGHRVAFLNSPDSSKTFKFSYLSNSKKSYQVVEQFNLSDIETVNENNKKSFNLFIKDNNDNYIGGFMMAEFTPYQTHRPLFMLSNIYTGPSDNRCLIEDNNAVSLGDNNFECKSPVSDTNYIIALQGVPRYKIGQPLANFDIDWLFTGENPDGSSTKKVDVAGSWKGSCFGGLSNGYYLVAACGDNVNQRKVTVNGNGKDLLNTCYNNDGITHCN